MKTNIRTNTIGLSVLLALAVAGCAQVKEHSAQGDDSDAHAAAVALMKQDFKARGQATMDRLDQDEDQKICTKYAQAKVPEQVAKDIESKQLATVKYPADGKLLGDWKSGEHIAQTGVGKQWSDNPAKPAGGNCYACHQLSPKELSFGTIGPSLKGYGKVRGNTAETQKYTYAKVYNAQAFNACSSMPRFGHQRILTEQQIKDVVALLLDPQSPVNQ